MRVTVVMDNTAPAGAPLPFLAEHGLSLLVELQGKKILVDTGQTGNVVRNLSLLKVHPVEINAIVLSHGHYDHTGGLAELLRHRGASIPVYAHPAVFQERYSRKGDNRRFAGLPFPKAHLASLGAEWRLSETPVEICLAFGLAAASPGRRNLRAGIAVWS